MLKCIKTVTTYEIRNLFMYDELNYLRVDTIRNGERNFYWSNMSENNHITGYSFEKWQKNLTIVQNLYLRYLRKEKLKRILK